MESSRAKKKSKKDDHAEKLSEEQLDTMVIIEEEDFFPEPLQVRHPIVDWKFFKEDIFTPSWKITRLVGETFSYIQFEDLIRSCDRDDLDTLR